MKNTQVEETGSEPEKLGEDVDSEPLPRPRPKALIAARPVSNIPPKPLVALRSDNYTPPKALAAAFPVYDTSPTASVAAIRVKNTPQKASSAAPCSKNAPVYDYVASQAVNRWVLQEGETANVQRSICPLNLNCLNLCNPGQVVPYPAEWTGFYQPLSFHYSQTE